MPGIDASIPLGAKAPDPTQSLSSFLNIANGVQTLQQNQQKTQQGAIDIQERQKLIPFLSNPANFTDDQGNIDFNKALPGITALAPTTGMKYVQDLMVAQKQHTDTQAALNNLTSDNRKQIGGVLAAIPPGSPPDVVEKTVGALTKQYKGMEPLAGVFMQGYQNALNHGGQAAGDAFVQQSARGVLPQETQQTMNTPNGVTVDNGQQSAVVNVKPGVRGMPQGAVIPGTQVQKLVPVGQQEQTITDAFGNLLVQHTDEHGTITGTRPLQSAAPSAPGPTTFPPNESPDTYKELQGQRTAAQQAANSAPVMHDINRTIVEEANKGFNTGTLGALTQKVASATGYHLGPNESATDYNVLGKMLERSALLAAQSMGPHTNAGLEAAVKANGSLEYTPQALKKIAYLNDALVSGSELYQKGLERAIQDSPNGVFAKRQYDQQWSQVATPQALRLKNAVDNGNQEEIGNIIKEVGGKGSKGAQKLHDQLTKLLQLSGTSGQ